MNKALFYFLINLFLLSGVSFASTTNDSITAELLNNKIVKTPIINDTYNYEDLEYKLIKLRIINEVKTELDLKDGDRLCFEVIQPVYYKGEKLAQKDEIVYAQVETVIKNGMNGIPASIIIGNFQFANIEPQKLQDEIEIYGADLSWLVFPLKWALTFLPPTGSLTNFIKGGHAKIKENDIITIKYYPNR